MLISNIKNLFRKEKNIPVSVSVELFVDAATHERLKKRILTENTSEQAVVVAALKRGMSDYWLYQAKAQRADYEIVKRVFAQSDHDNKLLRALEAQNIHFSEILEKTTKQGGIS